MKHRDSGLIFAVTIMTLWACMLYHCLFRHKLNFLTTPFLVLIQIYLYTGLFITAHDSIHGTVCSNATINYWVGKICLLSFAGFDYDFIREEHWKHHSHAGLEGEDPDFHHGKPQFLLWIFQFMVNYTKISQVCRLVIIVTILQYYGAPLSHLYVFMTGAGLTSALILFYYGTYVPHKPDDHAQDLNRPEGFRTLGESDNRLTSFLKCYNFGCHSEHHANPRIPWWALWDAHIAA